MNIVFGFEQLLYDSSASNNFLYSMPFNLNVSLK